MAPSEIGSITESRIAASTRRLRSTEPMRAHVAVLGRDRARRPARARPSGIVSAAAPARHVNASSGEVACANEPTPGPITAPVENRPMTMPASRASRSRGVLADSQAIEAAHVMPAAQPCSAACEVEHDGVRGEREGERRDRQQRRAGERHAAPADARREEAREQPDDRRRQRIGGQHDARARLREVEAVGVARQQRHDRLVERRLDEHRQADRDRDAARVHGSILPARAAAARGALAAPRQSSTMWMHTHSIIRRRDARAGSSRTTTLRLGAQAPLNRFRTGSDRNAIPPRPACVPRYGTTARGRRRPPAGPGRPTCSRQYSPYWDSSSGLRSPSSCMRSRGGSAEVLRAEAERELASARREADAVRKEAEVAAKEHMLAARSEVEEQLKGRSLEVARSEERLGARAAQLDQAAADVAAREGSSRRARRGAERARGARRAARRGAGARARARRRDDAGRRPARRCSRASRSRRATTSRAASARSRTRRASSPTGACATSSRSASSAPPRRTPPRRPSRASRCPRTR